MTEQMMSTKEVAHYLGIHEKQVYALIKDKKIPCTRVTGKWIFPRHIIDDWIASDAKGDAAGAPVMDRRGIDALFAAGSNDPILDILMSSIKSSGFNIFSSSIGSTEGLTLLKDGHTDISWCHLFDTESGEYNIPYISTRLSGMKIAIVHLFYRELGFVSSPNLPEPVKNFSEIADRGLRFINRQEGAGTRLLIDYHLGKNGIPPSAIKNFDREVFTHIEVGLNVLTGTADAGIATVAISKLLGLSFTPIVKESFDMVLTQDAFFKKGVQRFIEVLESSDFRKSVEPLGNYDFTESGKIIHTTNEVNR